MHTPRTLVLQRHLAVILLTLAIILSLFSAGGVALADGLPTASLDVPAASFLGEPLTFTLSFDNTGPDTGYGPFIDLIFPATGADGAGIAADDGITFTGATYLGLPVTAIQLTFPAGVGPTCVAHPYARDVTTAPLQVCGTPGDTLVVLQLPFGSFTPDQPLVDVTVHALLSDLADLDTPLTMRTRSGFQFGNDPLRNPCCDPSLVAPENPDSSAWPGSSVTPKLIELTKTYLGPENETATGPNFPRQYRIDVDIADGQTITNLDLTDDLPSNLQFVSVDSTLIQGTPTATTAISTPGTTTPGGTLTRRFASVTGTSAAADASMLFTFYVPRTDASNNAVIDAATGDDATAENNASALGTWTPVDTRDPSSPGNASADSPGPEHALTPKSIAIQKGHRIATDTNAPGYTPDDVLAYTLDFQVSDFFAFQSVVIGDTLSDGQRFDPSFTPTLRIDGVGFVLPAATMNAANYTVTANYTPDSPAPNDGTTEIRFRVSDELVTRGQSGQLLGGCVPAGGTGGPAPDCLTDNNGPTTGTIVFRAIIQDNFSDDFPSGDESVDEGDQLGNAVTISADLLNVADLSLNGESESDISSDTITIERGTLAKSIYAINGSTSFTSPVQVEPGDTVTYRLQADLPSSDVEDLVLTDYLPLPVFVATEVSTFVDTITDTAPPAGQARFGPDDTFRPIYGATPALTTSAADNAIMFTYGDYDTSSNQPSQIDILFTVTVSDDPFADGLFLTNQVRKTAGATNQPLATDDAIVQIQLNEPVLHISKGAIGSDNAAAALSPAAAGPVSFSAPGSTGPRWSGTLNSANLASAPIDSDIGGVDSGDRVSFAIVIENSGRSGKGAFDVTITDTIPLGFVIPASAPGLNLDVRYGDGTALTFTGLDGDANPNDDLFSSGIRLNDPPGQGACQQAHPTNGHNIIVITYDLEVDPNVDPGQSIPNLASITNYAGTAGGPNHVGADPRNWPTDQATTTIAPPTLTKTLVGTEIVNANNTNTQAVIGELATYRLVLTVPEGETPNARLVDTLDTGLAFVDLVSVTPSPGLTISGSTTPAITENGQTVTFDFGTITNTNRDNTITETITIEYRAVVLNVAGNQGGTQLNNSAMFSWNMGSLAPVSASHLTVIEPDITVGKTVDPATGDAGDPITYTLTLSGATGADAFEVALSDSIPADIVTPTIVSVTDSAGGVTAATFQLAGNTLSTVAPFDMPVNAGRTITLIITGTLSTAVTPGQVINNTATAQWSSMDGDIADRSAYTSDSDERTGTGGVNDYTEASTAALTVFVPAPVKSIVATSEAHTGVVSGVERVTIGEIVRYRLVVRLAEGTSPNFQIFDRIPGGLRFLNDNTARVALVANGVGISSSMLSGSGLTATGSETNLDSITPSFVLPDTAVSSNATSNDDSYGSGTDVYFKLGNLTNSDSDSDSEYIVVEFNALVENISSNQAFNNATGTQVTTTRNNDFQIRVNGSTIATSNQAPVRIAEPLINNLSKTVTTAPTDAGDMVVYTLTFSNTASGVNRASAFDVVLTDTLDDSLELLNVNTTVPDGSNFVDASTLSVGGQVQVTIDQLPTVTDISSGSTGVTIVVTARVVANAPDGLIIPNTASLIYTSLPGANGTPSNPTGSSNTGAPGSDTGERDGSGGVNDYAASDSATVTLATPTITKLAPTPTQYTIGDLVTYDIRVDLSEGTTQGLVVTDDLPPGLAFEGYSIITTGYAGSLGSETRTSPLSVPGSSGENLVLTFPATVTTDADNNATNNTFTVRVLARVLNVSGNQDGTLLNNTAALSYTNPNTGATATVNSSIVNITLIEPRMTITKTFTPGQAAANDTVTVTLTVENVGTSEAFEVIVEDPLPNASFTGITEGTTPAGFSFATVDAGANTVVTYTGGSIPAGASRTFTFTVTLVASVTAGDVITNIATVTQATTLPGSNPHERDEPDVDGSDDLTVIAPDIVITKDDGEMDVVPGQTLTYTITITNAGQRAATGVVVTDTLPLHTTFVSASTGGGETSAGSGVVTWPSFDLAAGAGVTRTVTIRLATPMPAGIISLTNSASAADDGTHGADPTPGNNSGTDTDTITVSSLGNYVWFDANGNGVQDAGEAGVNGVTVNLYDGTGNLIDSTTTTDEPNGAFAGWYAFAGLPPDDYSIEFMPPDGYAISPQDQGGSDNLDSDADPADGQTIAINLPAGVNDPTWDAGFYQSVRLGNRVWHDANNNGLVDNDEDGINGVEVQLFRAGDDPTTATPVATQTTSGGGFYTFTGLRPGDYFVYIPTPPADYPMSSIPTDTNDNREDNNDNGTQTSEGAPMLSPVVTLTSGGEPTDDGDDANGDLTIDFGFFAPYSLGNRVWHDANNNGALDDGESGISGVTVRIYRDRDDDGIPDGAAVDSTNTDSNGYYRFDNLTADTYIVEVETPDGYTSSTVDAGDPDIDADDGDDNGVFDTGSTFRSHPITLGPGLSEPTNESDLVGGSNPQGTDDGRANMTVDFGFYTMSLGNRVWYDVNNNGRLDGSEAGVENVTVSLYTDMNGDGIPDSATPLQTRITDAQGRYLFTGLAAGQYVIELTGLPEGYVSSTGGIGTNQVPGGPYEPGIAESNNAVDDGRDHGTQGNGTAFPETVIRSGVITLTAGSEPMGESDATLPNGLASNPAMDASTNTTVDFGIFLPASLGDYVWLDANHNGIQDEPASAGIGGVTVSLYDGDTLVGTTSTSASGYYQFTNLLPNHTYTVRLDNPADFAAGGPLEGWELAPQDAEEDDARDSDAALNGDSFPEITEAATSGPATNTPTYDFGFFKAASLGDRVWFDANGNGVQDAGERGISDVTVNLYDDNGELVATTTTDEEGGYAFTDLIPGAYVMEFVPPAGYRLSPQDQGDNDGRDSDPNSSTGRTIFITLDPGENDLTWDAGFYRPVSLGNLVWNDVNNNGVVDSGENGIDGVTVVLYRDANDDSVPDGSVLATTTTSAGGYYLFGDLLPGTYIVGLPQSNFSASGLLARFVSSTGINAVASGPYEEAPDPDNDIDNDDNGSARAGLGVISAPVTLVSGAEPVGDGDNDADSNLTVDFGFFRPAALGNLVWHDLNADGIRNAGEPGVAGVIASLYDAAGKRVATTTTDAHGFYAFTNLAPGTYSVGFSDLPGRYSFTDPDQGDDANDSDVDPDTGRTMPVTLAAGDNNSTLFAGLVDAGTTAVVLTSFTATWQTDAIIVRWETSSEIDTWGFHLYRSADGQRVNARRVTPDLILGQGRGQGGATYTWTDTDVEPGTTYTYWLVETEIDGTSNEYGPIKAQITASNQTSNRVFLPLLVR